MEKKEDDQSNEEKKNETLKEGNKECIGKHTQKERKEIRELKRKCRRQRERMKNEKKM